MHLLDFVQLTAPVRQAIGQRPFLLFVILLAGLLLSRRFERAPLQSPAWRRILTGISILMIVLYAAVPIWYAWYPQYADAAEPSIAAIAILFAQGQPIYHDVGSPSRYSHMYGPLAFMIPGWCFYIFGKSLAVSKLPGVVAGLLSLVTVFCFTRPIVGRWVAMIVVAVFAVLCLDFRHTSFWIRPDSFELLLAAFGILLATRMRDAKLSAVAIGCITGLLVNLKLTGPCYVLPAFAIVAFRSGVAGIMLAISAAAGLAVAPFVAYENISWSNYRVWIQASAENGLAFSILRQNMEWAFFFLIPLAPTMLRRSIPKEEGWYLGSLVMAIMLVSVAASKPGAGPYHLLPFLPAIAYPVSITLAQLPAGARPLYHCRMGALALVLTASVIASIQLPYFLWSATRTPGPRLEEDLQRLIEAHRTVRIEMGYSASNEAYAYLRPLLVFHQGAFFFDAPAIQEHQLSGVAFPDAAIHAIESCQAPIWLMPRGGDPFSLRNRYRSTQHIMLFPDPVRAAFLRSYRKTGNTEYFDVWNCEARR